MFTVCIVHWNASTISNCVHNSFSSYILSFVFFFPSCCVWMCAVFISKIDSLNCKAYNNKTEKKDEKKFVSRDENEWDEWINLLLNNDRCVYEVNDHLFEMHCCSFRTFAKYYILLNWMHFPYGFFLLLCYCLLLVKCSIRDFFYTFLLWMSRKYAFWKNTHIFKIVIIELS